MARRALKLREGIAPVWDRLLAMGFLAALLHGLVILGITFNTSAGEKSAAPGLEVLLTSEELPTAEKNPTATYLAQRTQLGSGNTREPVAPHNPAALLRLQHAGTPEGDSLADSGATTGARAEQLLTTTAWNTQVRYLGEQGSSGTARNRPLLLDEPPVADPGPADEPGPTTLRGPKRDELWITPDTNPAPPPGIKALFPDLVPEVPQVFERRIQGRMPLLRVGWAVIRPAQTAAAAQARP